MRKRTTRQIPGRAYRAVGGRTAAVAGLLCFALAAQGCFSPVYPQLDREERVVEALGLMESRPGPPSPLSPSQAVCYALAHNLDAKVAEIEMAYSNESAVAARRRLLPSLTMRYSFEHSSHPDARRYEAAHGGAETLPSSYNADPNFRQGDVGLMWNMLDFGVGYLRSRQQGEVVRQSAENYRRVRQQVALDVLSHYWRTAAAIAVAREADDLRRELERQAASVRDSVGLGTLNTAEGARRELALHTGLSELEQWSGVASQARLDLGRALGCGNAPDISLMDFPASVPEAPPIPNGDPSVLQTAALQRRPELFQQDAQERIAVDKARLALLQMAPNATLSLNYHDNPDKFLEWNNWMTVGARVSWNIFNIPARLAEKRAANLQGETARQKGLALAAAIMAQVGLAFSEWKIHRESAERLSKRAEARERLVEALAGGESRPGEMLEERVRLLGDRAAALRAMAEARVAEARLANAIGLDIDADGRLLWQLGGGSGVDLLRVPEKHAPPQRVRQDDLAAAAMLPPTVSGLKVVLAEDFESPAEYFLDNPPALAGRKERETKGIKDAPEELSAMAVAKDMDEAPKQTSVTGIGVDRDRFAGGDIASIDKWARGGGFPDEPKVEPIASMVSASDFPVAPPRASQKRDEPAVSAKPAKAAARPAETRASDAGGNIMRTEDMRRLYSGKRREPPKRYDRPSSLAKPDELGDIPGLSVSDFMDPAARSLMNPAAWRTVGDEEIQELASMGLTDPSSNEWNAPAIEKTPERREPTLAESMTTPGGWHNPKVGVSGARLSPPEGGVASLRPPPAGGAEALRPDAPAQAAPKPKPVVDGVVEAKKALEPLEPLDMDAPKKKTAKSGAGSPVRPGW